MFRFIYIAAFLFICVTASSARSYPERLEISGDEVKYFFITTGSIPMVEKDTDQGLCVLSSAVCIARDIKGLADALATLTRERVVIDAQFLRKMIQAKEAHGFSYERIVQVINDLPDKDFSITWHFIRDVFFYLKPEVADRYLRSMHDLLTRGYKWQQFDQVFRSCKRDVRLYELMRHFETQGLVSGDS